MESNSFDIDLIHGDIYDRLCKKNGYHTVVPLSATIQPCHKGFHNYCIYRNNTSRDLFTDVILYNREAISFQSERDSTKR